MKRINTEFEDVKLFKLNYADSKLAAYHQYSSLYGVFYLRGVILAVRYTLSVTLSPGPQQTSS